MGAIHSVLLIEAATGSSSKKAPGGRITMRFLKRRASVRIIVAGAAGVIFAVTGFRGSAGPANAGESAPAANVPAAVASVQEENTTMDNWPWG
ncbi:hypothetical protein Areg01_65020 [Actinoplanes regularis]|nr:hypothetical protein Areg01_65020 [Actinoplanes regularis]